MNLVFKGMCIKDILRRYQATRTPSATGTKFYWKTTDVDYRKTQVPLFEGVGEAWRQLSVDARKEFGCGNVTETNYPTKHTAEVFLSNAKKDWGKHKNSPTNTGLFWKSMTPVMNALNEVDRASSNDGDGTDARQEVAAEARKEMEQRKQDRINESRASGSIAEVLDSLSDQASTIGSSNHAGVEIAEEQVSLARKNLQMMTDNAEYQKTRDDKTDRHREEQTKLDEKRWVEQTRMVEARQKKTDTQHGEMVDLFSPSLKAPEGGVTIPWDTSEEFWSALPNVAEAVCDTVVENLPTLEDLVTSAAESDFANARKEAGIPVLVAGRIAKFVQKSCCKNP